MNRREMLTAAVGALALRGAELPPVRPITKGPRFHWFGYYDKLQFDPTSRFVLGVSNNFQHRLPTAEDSIGLGMVDTAEGDRWIPLGEGACWSWHQTNMIQWLPGSKDEVIWNDRQGTKFVSHIVNVRTRDKRTLPSPIYCVSPDGRFGLVNDFARSFSMRPETGYAGGIDPFADDPAPAGSGIWRVDLKTGERDLIISLADVVKIPLRSGSWSGSKHYFDHLLVAPDAKRFTFLQRWGKGVGTGFSTRMFTAGVDGKDLRVIDDSGRASHFNWRDPRTLILWTEHPSNGASWYLIDERTAHFEVLDAEKMNRNGHISYLPGRRWIVSDTSPDDERKQSLYLYDTRTRNKIALGAFVSPPEYKGFWRCDTTPRNSPDGRKIVFDSPHDLKGRQMYLIDLTGVRLS